MITIKLNNGKTLEGYSYASGGDTLKIDFLGTSLDDLRADFTDEFATRRIEIDGEVFEGFKTDYLTEYTGGIKEVGMVKEGSAEDEAVYHAAIELAKIQAEDVDDETAVKIKELYDPWSGKGVEYKTGKRLQYAGLLYKVLQDHTSQPDWTPDVAPSLYVRIDDPAEEWPEWRQPVGSEDAYHQGDKVSHNGSHWISDVDGNVWEPGVYGWTEA